MSPLRTCPQRETDEKGDRLPAPTYSTPTEEVAEPSLPASTAALTLTTTVKAIPPYGERNGWRPSASEDFGDGGAYPECHLAQFPLEMGRKKKVSIVVLFLAILGSFRTKQTTNGNTLSLQVDAEGNVRYDAIGGR